MVNNLGTPKIEVGLSCFLSIHTIPSLIIIEYQNSNLASSVVFLRYVYKSVIPIFSFQSDTIGISELPLEVPTSVIVYICTVQ
jgi:hypothetical protein